MIRNIKDLYSYLEAENYDAWIQAQDSNKESWITSRLHCIVNQIIIALGELEVKGALCKGSMWASYLWRDYISGYCSELWGWLVNWEGDKSNAELINVYRCMIDYAIQRIGHDQMLGWVHRYTSIYDELQSLRDEIRWFIDDLNNPN